METAITVGQMLQNERCESQIKNTGGKRTQAVDSEAVRKKRGRNRERAVKKRRAKYCKMTESNRVWHMQTGTDMKLNRPRCFQVLEACCRLYCQSYSWIKVAKLNQERLEL